MIRRHQPQFPSPVMKTVNVLQQFLSLFVCAWVMFSSALARRFQNLVRSILQHKFFLFYFIHLRYHCIFISKLPDSMILIELKFSKFDHQYYWVMKLVLYQQFETKSEIRAACIQVLFSAVYNLKSAVLPYAYDLLKFSIKALRKESEKVNFFFLY